MPNHANMMNNFFRNQGNVENDGISFDSTDPIQNGRQLESNQQPLTLQGNDSKINAKPNDILFSPPKDSKKNQRKSLFHAALPSLFSPKSNASGNGNTNFSKESEREDE